MHLALHNVSLGLHIGVTAGTSGLRHDTPVGVCGMSVPAIEASIDTSNQVRENRLEFAGIVVFLGDVTSDYPICTGL